MGKPRRVKHVPSVINISGLELDLYNLATLNGQYALAIGGRGR